MAFFTRGPHNKLRPSSSQLIGSARSRRKWAMSAIEQFEARTLLAVNLLGVPDWIEQGPGPIRHAQTEGMNNTPVAGAVHAVAAHPTNADILFVGTVNGGVWRTTNASAASPSWTPLTDQFPSLSIGAMEFDPADATGNTLLVGIGRFSAANGRGGDQTGALYTTNALAMEPTWSQLTDGIDDKRVSGVAARGSTLLVATSAVGLYRSTDGGQHFELLNTDTVTDSGLLEGGIFDLVGDPGDPMVFYASTRYRDGNTQTGAGLFRSDDGGATWTDISDGIAGLDATTQNIEMSVHSNGANNVVYVGVVSDLDPDPNERKSRLSGVFRSVDSGGSWTPMDIPETLGLIDKVITGATNASPIVITSSDHGLDNGDKVVIQGVTGNTAANGTFTVIKISDDTFSLDGSTGNGDYAGDGTWQIVDGLQPGNSVSKPENGESGGQGATHFSIVAHPTDPNLVFVGGDRQNKTIRLVGGNFVGNSVGANNSTGRLFRGDASVDATGQVNSPQWTSITDNFADPTSGATNPITGATNATPIVITSNAHGLATGDRVNVAGVAGNMNARGLWTVTVIDANRIALDGSIGNANYTGGGTWRRPGTAPHADSREMVFDANGNIIEGDDGGVYRRTNPTSSTGAWSSVNGDLRAVEFFSVAYDPKHDIIFGGAQDNGTSEQGAPGSTTWDAPFALMDNGGGDYRRNQRQQGDGFVNAIDVTSTDAGADSLRYSFTSPGTFLRRRIDSSNSLVNVTQVRLASTAAGDALSGLLAQDREVRFTLVPYVLNAADPRLMMLGSSGLYEDADTDAANGLAGDVVTRITGNGFAPDAGAKVSAIAYGGRRNGAGQTNVAYVGLSSGELFVRGETGATFTSRPVGGSGPIRDIVLDPDDWRTAYVVRETGVFMTIDEGANFTPITDNLDKFTSQLQSVTLFDPASGTTDGEEIVLVGGRQGAFRRLGDMWSEYGRGLPNALVLDVQAIGGGEDILLTGTLGRGAWTVADISASIATPGVLQIDGDTDFPGQDDTIRLVRNASNPSLLDVFLNNTSATPTETVPLSTLSQINVRGLGGNDSLILDSSNGLIDVALGIRFDGGTGSDSATLQQTGGDSQDFDTYSVGRVAGSGTSRIFGNSGTQSLTFENIEPLIDNVPSDQFRVEGSPADNAINYTTIGGNGFVTIDNFESVLFANKIVLTIDGDAGADTFNLSGSDTPDGLNNILIDGGDPAGVDTLIVSGVSVSRELAFNLSDPDDTFVNGASGADGEDAMGTPLAVQVAFTRIERIVAHAGSARTLAVTVGSSGTGATITPGATNDGGTIDAGPVPIDFTGFGAGTRLRLVDTSGFFSGVTLNGTGADDSFNVIDDALATTTATVNTSFRASLTTVDFESLTINGLGGADDFFLNGTNVFSSYNLNGGDPAATDSATIAGTGAADTFDLDLATAGVTALGSSIQLSGVEDLAISGFGGIDTINVAGLGSISPLRTVSLLAAGASLVNVNGSSSSDSVIVEPASAGAGRFSSSAGGPSVHYQGFSGAFTVDGGAAGFDTLTIRGDDEADIVSATATTVTIKGGVATLGAGLDRLVIETFGGSDILGTPASPLAGLAIPTTIDTGSGNDAVDASGVTAATLTILGGDGDDALTGGSLADRLEGGSGDDALTGGPGPDSMFGGDGSDRHVWNNGDGSDLIEGGAGQNSLSVNGSLTAGDSFVVSSNGVRVRFERVNFGFFTLDVADVQQLDLALGGGGDLVDVRDVTGTALVAVNIDLGAADSAQDIVTVEGRTLADAIAIDVDGGVVTLDGTSTRMRLTSASAANDVLQVRGNSGDDLIEAADGVSALIAMQLEGNAGRDTIVGEATILGGAGDDILTGGVGGNIILGGAGSDVISGRDGVDTLLGDASATGVGASFLVVAATSGQGNDTIDGGAGNDLLNGDLGDDSILGGDGADTIDLLTVFGLTFAEEGEDVI